MVRIIGTRGVGKTTEIVKTAIEKCCIHDTIIFVVSNKDYVQGIIDGMNPTNRVIVMSYKEFIEKRKEINSFAHIFIDEVEGLI